LRGNGSTGSAPDDRTNGRSTAATHYPANNRSGGTAHDCTTKRILCGCLLHRHRKGYGQKN
jgi:hypothetical protein